MKKPNALIKLFTQNNNKYLYDANKNRILKLTSESYNEINHYLNSPGYSSEIITALKRKGYLLDSCIQTIEHPFTPFVEQILQSHISTLILQVTQRCNFRCRYCTFAFNGESTRTHTNQSMSFEIAQKSIDFLSMHCADSRNVTLAFYGGEPLLNFDLIKKSVEYSKSVIYNKPVNYSMTTNFYVATDEMIDFLEENQFDLLISLDGPENIQNYHRRLAVDGSGTYNTVVNNILKIKNKYPDYFNSHVQFNPVVLSDENPFEIINYYTNVLGVAEHRIHLQRVDDTGLDISYDPMDSNLEKMAETLLDSKSISYYESVLNDNGSIAANYHINGSCVPGSDKLFVTAEGLFFPCEKVNECNKNMQIGSLEKGFDVDKIKYLMNIGYLNQDNCKKCWAIRFCKICCAHCDDGKTNLSGVMLKNKCNITYRETIKYFKKLVIDNAP